MMLPRMKAKSELMASLIQTFLPIIDMVIPQFDLEHASEAVGAMIQEADRYDTLSVVIPGGWKSDDQQLLVKRAELFDAIVKMIKARKAMIEHVTSMEIRRGQGDDLMKELFPTLQR